MSCFCIKTSQNDQTFVIHLVELCSYRRKSVICQGNSTFHLVPDATTFEETSDDTSERNDISKRDVNKSLFHYLNHEHLS